MKKIVRLTENELTKIIKQSIDEKLGVPDNIYESALRIYNDFLRRVKSIPLDSNKSKYRFGLYGDYRISDYKFKGVDFEFEILSHNSTEFEIEFLEAGVVHENRFEKNKISILPNNGVLMMYMKIMAPTGWKIKDIIDHLKQNKPIYVSNFTHELKHSYDDSKKTTSTVQNRTEYRLYQDTKISNIIPINLFLYYSYFIHKIEEGVRSSELYSLLKSNNITKSQFKKFFYDTGLIKNFKYAKDFKLSNLIKELHEYMPLINDVIDQILEVNPDIEKVPPDASDDEKIKIFLNLFYQIISTQKINYYNDYLKQNVNQLDFIFGLESPDEINKMAQTYAKKVNKYENYQDFFGNEEKRFNFVGNKMIKKLSKLYDMMEDDKKSSIGNWDLHQKINKAGEKTLEEIKKLAREGKLKLTAGKVYKKK